MNAQTTRKYLPSAGKDWLLPLYDPLTYVMGINFYRKKLINEAGLQPGQCILDIGCGTGTLLLMIKKRFPKIEATGIDPDRKALSMAAHKAERTGRIIRFDGGFSDDLPYGPETFDRIFSSFTIHHLHARKTEATFREVRRVLKSGGSFHFIDFEHWNSPKNVQKKPMGNIHELIKVTEFSKIKKLERMKTLFGSVICCIVE